MVSFGAMMLAAAWMLFRIPVQLRISADRIEILRVFSKKSIPISALGSIRLHIPRSPLTTFEISTQFLYAPGKLNPAALDLVTPKGKRLARVIGSFENFRDLPAELVRLSEGKITLKT